MDVLPPAHRASLATPWQAGGPALGPGLPPQARSSPRFPLAVKSPRNTISLQQVAYLDTQPLPEPLGRASRALCTHTRQRGALPSHPLRQGWRLPELTGEMEQPRPALVVEARPHPLPISRMPWARGGHCQGAGGIYSRGCFSFLAGLRAFTLTTRLCSRRQSASRGRRRPGGPGPVCLCGGGTAVSPSQLSTPTHPL